MNELKKLQEKMAALIEEQSILETAVNDADDAGREIAQNALSSKSVEVKVVRDDLDVAITLATEKAMNLETLNKAKALEATKVPDGVKVAGEGDDDSEEAKIAAAAKDYGKELRAKELLFTRYFTTPEKNLVMSGEERKAMGPKEGTKFADGAGAAGVVVPKSFALRMLGSVEAAKNLGWSDYDLWLATKASSLTSAVPSLGGYLVPQDFRADLLQLPYEAPAVLNRATMIEAPTGTVTWPKMNQTDSDEYSGMAGEWLAEGGTKPQTNPTFTQEEIATYEYAMWVEVTHRVLSRTPISINRWLSTAGRAKMIDTADSAVISGTGTGQPTGFLETAGIHEVAREVVNQVSWNDCVDLIFKLKPQNRANGTFVLDDTVLAYLWKLKDLEGRGLFTASMANGPFDRLCGYPYISTTRTPNLGTDGDISFIDLSHYIIPMEQDIVMVRDDSIARKRNAATIFFYIVMGGELLQPRVCAKLGNEDSS